MKFFYIQSYQPCAPKEIRRDRDVKIFLRQVTEVVLATSLYMKMFFRDAEFYFMEQVNHNNFGTFNSGSGSNHFSTFRSSTKLREKTFLYAQNVEKAKVHENPIRENIFWESPIKIIMCGKVLLGKLNMSGKLKHLGKLKCRKHKHIGKLKF